MADDVKDGKGKEQELAKQLSTYADSITAFSFVQGATFCFLVGQSKTVACVLAAKWGVAEACLIIAGAGYFALLFLCHRNEEVLVPLKSRGEKISRVVRTIRLGRLCIVGVATLGEILMVIGAHFAIPAFDCAKVLQGAS